MTEKTDSGKKLKSELIINLVFFQKYHILYREKNPNDKFKNGNFNHIGQGLEFQDEKKKKNRELALKIIMSHRWYFTAIPQISLYVRNACQSLTD